MAKGTKHMKTLKSEKAKVKLKAKKQKKLPKGLNVTDPSFKVKKIVIREQLQQHDESEILSKRKLNIKDLLSRLQHHNSTVRQQAVRELKEILSQHAPEVLSSQFGSLLQGVAALALDREKDIRKDSLKVLSLILGPISNEQLLPYCDVLISYLRCAMTHIDPRIKEDALLFLDVLVQSCSTVLARNSHKILPNFLDMISKLHSEMKPGRQLTTTINSKNTSAKWRIKVLERLADMFNSIVHFYKSQKSKISNVSSSIVRVDERTKYIPIHKALDAQICEIDFEQSDASKENAIERSLDAEELVKYIEQLMPLIFDSWIEVCPDEKKKDQSHLLITPEAADLLKSIVEIIQLITECIDMLESDCESDTKLWFKRNFQHLYMKNLLARFPYSKASITGRTKKRQEDFLGTGAHDGCLSHNLGLCQIHVWFTSMSNSDRMNPLSKQYSSSITEYLNEKLVHWSNTDNPMLPQLIKVLRTLFLTASSAWYENSVDLSEILLSVVNACHAPANRELQLQLFTVLSDVIMDHTLSQLHREEAFKQFITTLPKLLLKSKIYDNTVQMINRVVLRYRDWIRDQLVANHEAIIENARKIDVIGSENVKESRLMICNLFYFMDAQIYY